MADTLLSDADSILEPRQTDREALLERALMAISEGVKLQAADGTTVIDTLPFEVRRALNTAESKRVDRRRDGIDVARGNGTVLNVREQTLSDGATIIFARDVSVQRREEEELRDAVHTDPDTGNANLLAISMRGAEAVAVAKRYDRPLSILRIEIEESDDAETDEDLTCAILRFVAETCRHTLRTADTLATLDKTTLVALLPETNAENAEIAADRLTDRISRSDLLFKGRSQKPKISTGVAQYQPHIENFEELMEQAYRAASASIA